MVETCVRMTTIITSHYRTGWESSRSGWALKGWRCLPYLKIQKYKCVLFSLIYLLSWTLVFISYCIFPKLLNVLILCFFCPLVINKNSSFQEFVHSTNHPVLIISYEMFVRTIEVIQSLTFDLIICDEGHRLKNASIKTTTVCIMTFFKHFVVCWLAVLF